MTKVGLSNFKLLSYSVKWPLSDACNDQVPLKAYSQATTLETHTSPRTQPVRRCKPELVEALYKPVMIAWLRPSFALFRPFRS